MQICLQVFVNFKLNNYIKFIFKFIYNNIKNTSTSYMLFKLNFKHYSNMLYKNNITFSSKFKLANKLSTKLKKLIIVY